jgi:hypothetical protein
MALQARPYEKVLSQSLDKDEHDHHSFYLRSQSIALLCRRWGHSAGGFQLSLAKGGHNCHAGNRTPGGPQRGEPQPRPPLAVDRAMSLLPPIGEILALPDSDPCLVSAGLMLNRRGITAPLIPRELLRHPLGAHGLG